MGRGAVISDLHLLTNRTTASSYMPAIRKAASESRLFILNGDIFDFCWSRHDGLEASVEAAVDWVEALVHEFPRCTFVFMAGNHDSVPAYVQRMVELSENISNLFWEDYFVQLGSRIFLHGDVFHAGGSRHALDVYRSKWSNPLIKHPLFHGLYWATSKSGAQLLILPFLFKRHCAERITQYFEETISVERLAGLSDVYFGHVHRSFEDFSYKRLMFHNTGAALYTMKLRVIEFELTGSDLIFSSGNTATLV